MFKLFKLLFGPEDDLGGGGEDTDDVINILGEDDEPNEEVIEIPKETKKSSDDKKGEDEKEDETDDDEKEGDDEEEDELKDLLEEIEEPDDEKLEVVTPVRRQEILKKYPTLFKDFPYLEKAYYREQQFTQMFPTIDEAKEAQQKVQVLDSFERDLMSGNTATILAAVKEQDPESFHRIVDDYLPTLAKVDKDAYLHVLGNVSKHTIMSMLQEAKASNNEPLQQAAQILHQFVFGSSKWSPPTRLSKENTQPDEKETELSRREQQFAQQQFESVRGELNTRVNNSLRATIEANVDPKNSMSEYIKRNAVREAQETLANLISNDKRFLDIMDRLWKKAFDNNLSKDSTDRIRQAYLSKAKTLLPSVLKKARNDALKGMGKRVKEERLSPSGEKPDKPQSKPSGKITKPEEIPKGMTALEFLMQD